MCGISGFIDFNKNLSAADLRISTDKIDYRGPDDSGVFFKETQYANIGLGHRRLSILDPTPAGHQPMEFQHYKIIFNGEIYNYKEIEKDLISLGYQFDTGTDTEMILKAYDYWGLDCVKRFRGMWAFAIYDAQKEEIILCRDRVGVKPLYWYRNDNCYLFSSELKVFYSYPNFPKDLNSVALSLFMQYGYITAPHTIFNKTWKLEPGHFLKILSDGSFEKFQYWNLEDAYLEGELEAETWESKQDVEVEEELEQILINSFKLRMVSDVPVGMFLSGGVDSSLVAGILQKHHHEQIKTFTIGFEEKKYNEAPYAKAVAQHLNTDHTELYCTSKEASDIIPMLPDLYDEPFGDSSAIPTFLVSQLARSEVKVSLSADGADEQFFGYNRYIKSLQRENGIWNMPGTGFLGTGMSILNPEIINSILRKDQISNNFLSKYQKLRSSLNSNNSLERYDLQMKIFTEMDIQNLGLKSKGISNIDVISAKIKNLPHHKQMLLLDTLTYMIDDILVKVDRSTMAVSLEGREPFLDHHILEYAAKLPLKFKYRNGRTKYILKRILEKYVPKELIDRPKQGFGIPAQQWFRNDLKELYVDYLNKDRIKKQGIFNAREVNSLLNEYIKKGTVSDDKLWFIFMFQLWHEKYIS